MTGWKAGLSAALLVSTVLAGCDISVAVHPAIDDVAYKAAWRTGWAPVIRDAEPLAPSSASPGVCNKGGTKQGCYDTDEQLATDLQQLLSDLQGAKVPPEYQRANASTEQAISLDIQGLRQRDVGIAQDDSIAFGQAVDKLGRANGLFRSAYGEFPDYDRPTPSPFGDVGYSG